MDARNLVRAVLCALFLQASAAGAAAPPPETVRIGGTGGALGTMRLLGDAFERVDRNSRVEVLPSLGTGGGIRAVLAGAIDLAVGVRPATDEERRGGAVATPYGKTALVFAVHEGAPPISLTTTGVAEIYGGKRDRWPDGTPFRLILRPENGSETTTLLRMSPEVARAVRTSIARKGMIYALTEQDAADRLEKLPGTFGPTVLSLALSEKRRFRVLPLDGVVPSVETIADGSYPSALARTYHAVTGPSASPATRRFLAFLLTPEAGRILSMNGHVPVTR